MVRGSPKGTNYVTMNYEHIKTTALPPGTRHVVDVTVEGGMAGPATREEKLSVSLYRLRASGDTMGRSH